MSAAASVSADRVRTADQPELATAGRQTAAHDHALPVRAALIGPLHVQLDHRTVRRFLRVRL